MIQKYYLNTNKIKHKGRGRIKSRDQLGVQGLGKRAESLGFLHLGEDSFLSAWGRGVKSEPTDLLTLVLFLRAMLSLSLFLRVWQMGTCRREASFEKILSQAGHCICLISCALRKQLSSSLSFTWQGSLTLTCLACPCLTALLMTGSVHSSLSLKLTSVLDFLFVFSSLCGVSGGLLRMAGHSSACFSQRVAGILSEHSSQVRCSLGLGLGLSWWESLLDGYRAFFLGEMTMGLSEVHSLRWYLSLPLKKLRVQCGHCSYYRGSSGSISWLCVYSNYMGNKFIIGFRVGKGGRGRAGWGVRGGRGNECLGVGYYMRELLPERLSWQQHNKSSFNHEQPWPLGWQGHQQSTSVVSVPTFLFSDSDIWIPLDVGHLKALLGGS